MRPMFKSIGNAFEKKNEGSIDGVPVRHGHLEGVALIWLYSHGWHLDN